MSIDYSRERYKFGRPCNFVDVEPEIIAQFRATQIQKNVLRQEKQIVTLDTVSDVVASGCETFKVEFTSRGCAHNEGGWPTGIDIDDVSAVKRYRKRVEKNVCTGVSSTSSTSLNSALEGCSGAALQAVLSNGTIDVTETYFSGQEWDRNIAPTAGVLAVFRDPNAAIADGRRSATSVEWHPRGMSRVAVSYSILAFQDKRAKNMSMRSYIWDLGRPAIPCNTLEPPSPLSVLRFHPLLSDTLLGGSYNGQISLFDVRKSIRPCESSLIEKSHHDPIYEIHFTQGKSGNLISSVSTDGFLNWWDLRRLKEPIATTILLDSTGRACGGRSMSYDSSNPTKFLIGTEQGLLLAVDSRNLSNLHDSKSGQNVKKKKEKKQITMEYIADHTGPIVSTQRNPFLSRYFMSVGDWTVKLWCEDLSSPIFSTNYCDSTVTAGCWSASRPGLLFSGRSDGILSAWDLYSNQISSSLDHKVSDNAITSIGAQSKSNEFEVGSILAAGDASGSVHVLSLSKGLYLPADGERQSLMNSWGRAERSEKNLLSTTKKQMRRRKIDRALKKAQEVENEALEKKESLVDLNTIDNEFLEIMMSLDAKEALKHTGTKPHRNF
eukprot:g4632.t1